MKEDDDDILFRGIIAEFRNTKIFLVAILYVRGCIQKFQTYRLGLEL